MWRGKYPSYAKDLINLRAVGGYVQGPGGGTQEPCCEFVGEGKENTHFYIDPQALKDLPQFPLMENHRMKSQRNPNRDLQ